MNSFTHVMTFWYSMNIWEAWRQIMGSFSCSLLPTLKSWMLYYNSTAFFWRLTLCGGSSHKTRYNFQSKHSYCKIPAWCAVLIGRDNDNLHCHRCPEQINHLLMAQGGHGHLADLHQAAALAQPRLPCVAVGLHVCHNALVVHMETQLAQAIPAQGHLHCFTALGHKLGIET